MNGDIMPSKIPIPTPERLEIGQALEKALALALEPVCELEKLKRKPFITPKEVEALYGISRATLKAWRKDGKGPQYKQLYGNGSVFYTHEEIRKFISNAMPPVLVSMESGDMNCECHDNPGTTLKFQEL